MTAAQIAQQLSAPTARHRQGSRARRPRLVRGAGVSDADAPPPAGHGGTQHATGRPRRPQLSSSSPTFTLPGHDDDTERASTRLDHASRATPRRARPRRARSRRRWPRNDCSPTRPPGLVRRGREPADQDPRPGDLELPELLLRRPAPGQEPVHAAAAEGRRDRRRRHDPRPDRPGPAKHARRICCS